MLASGLGTFGTVPGLLSAGAGATFDLVLGSATPPVTGAATVPGNGSATALGAGTASSPDAGGATISSSTAFSDVAEPSPLRRRELAELLRNDCGACHGGRLRGGLGTPLVPEALVGKSVEALARVIYYGVPDTAMPPWGRFLTREEAAWLASQLKKGVSSDAR